MAPRAADECSAASQFEAISARIEPDVLSAAAVRGTHTARVDGTLCHSTCTI